MKQQTIVHISEEISSLEAIYELFRHSGGIDFSSNLDALEDILSDIQGLHIIIDDFLYFRTIFDKKMTKKYFGKRIAIDEENLSELLLQIFEPYLSPRDA